MKDIPLNHLRAINIEFAKEEKGGCAISILGITISRPDQKFYRLVAVTGDDPQTILGNPLLAEEAAIVARAGIPNLRVYDKQGSVVRTMQIGVVGYEIPFNRHFYQYEPPRDLKEIDADLDVLSAEIMEMLREVHS